MIFIKKETNKQTKLNKQNKRNREILNIEKKKENSGFLFCNN